MIGGFSGHALSCVTETPATNRSIDGACMSTALWLIIGGIGIATASFLFKNGSSTRLPDITDEQFLKLYRLRFDTLESRVFEGRTLLPNIWDCLITNFSNT